MATLYWNPQSGSLAPMAVLEALREATGQDYDAVKVDTKAGVHKSAAYLTEVHPLGTVPALKLDSGQCLLESSAMTLYLADLVPDQELAPSPAAPERGPYLDWMIYGATSIYTLYMRIYHVDQHTPDGVRHDAIADLARIRIRERWQVVENALSARTGPWLVRETPTAADLYLAMLALWYFDHEEFARLWPRTTALRQAAFAVPCMARANLIHVRD